MENNNQTSNETSVESSHKRRDSIATRISAKLPMLTVTPPMFLSHNSSSTSVPSTPLDTEIFNLSVTMNPEDYEIQHPIGFGSSAVVYAALYKPANKRVAIKLIDLDMFGNNQIEELRRELQIMTLCKHKNLLPVYGAFVNNSKLYIVTPYLAGGSCLHIMKTMFPNGLDETAIATILKECLLGLDYLHRNGHIHRDIKAGNLLMDETGFVYLADFGVSSSLMEHGERKSQRRTFVGTPCWMAPEVLTPERGYNAKADIWSFGITALELATGQAPYAKFPPLKVLMLTLQHEPPTLEAVADKSKFSRSFAQMIDSCLQKNPEKRPTCEELLKHSFFKKAKSKEYLTKNLLANMSELKVSSQNAPRAQSGSFERGVSWDFDDVDSIASTDFLEMSPSPIETTEMYNSLSRDMKHDLPAIEESDEYHTSKPSSPTSDTDTVKRGRFSVNIQKEDRNVSSERRGRFAVSAVNSPEQQESKTRLSSMSSDESSAGPKVSVEQMRGIVERSSQIRKILVSSVINKQIIDEVVSCMAHMESIINSTADQQK